VAAAIVVVVVKVSGAGGRRHGVIELPRRLALRRARRRAPHRLGLNTRFQRD
jgi:hypothetical protein